MAADRCERETIRWKKRLNKGERETTCEISRGGGAVTAVDTVKWAVRGGRLSYGVF